MSILADLSNDNYRTQDLLDKVLSAILDGNHSEDYVVDVLQLSQKNLSFFTELMVALTQFVRDPDVHMKERQSMVRRAIKRI